MKKHRRFWFCLALAFSTRAFSAELAKAVPVFRLHLAKEPASLDPHLQNSSAASYVEQNLFRNLYSFKDDAGLTPELAESCKWQKPTLLVCRLKKDLKWSDGTPLVAEDFLHAYQRLLDPKEAAPRADLLFKIKNAEAVYRGTKPKESFGVTAPDSRTLKFELTEADSEFEYALSNYLLTPIKNKTFSAKVAKDLVTNGPYKIAEWVPGEKIILESNHFYDHGKNANRPRAEFLFIAEDSVALDLYEKGTLSFLRRLPTLYIPTFKKRSDFLWVPVIRFDYIGFGPVLSENPSLREALAYSLNYPELQRIFSSEGVPGCPGIPKSWMKEELCYNFDLPRAKAALLKSRPLKAPLKMVYSVMGGEDHRRGAEWYQDQWKKNLNLEIQSNAHDNKLFLAELESGPPDLFRKGSTPDRPTCLSALEIFSEKNPENYLKLKDLRFEKLLSALAKAKNPEAKKGPCTEAIRYLLNQHWLIPTGPIHFAMLAKPEFKGWNINSLNQLDLAGLKAQNKP